jgi:hypothetical protein
MKIAVYIGQRLARLAKLQFMLDGVEKLMSPLRPDFQIFTKEILQGVPM